jgi:orotidine-5'-phosphate decarboxylase
VREIVGRGKRVFVDLKLHDIPRTVARAVEALVVPGVEFLTLHAWGGGEMLLAAAEALAAARQRDSAVNTRLLAVTVLTSLDDSDLREIGVDHSVQGQVLNLARVARSAGIHGLVASPHEVRLLRAELGGEPVIVTPGVRLAEEARHDQKRVMSPAEAIREGSDFLVMGRSLLDAPNPESILDQVSVQVAEALSQRGVSAS